jgi:hypothetical protein
MSHIMGRLAHIPKILEELGCPTFLARSGMDPMARGGGHRRTTKSRHCGTANTRMLQPVGTKPNRETGILVELPDTGKPLLHLGVNELLNKSIITRSHAGKHRPLQLIKDEVAHINFPLTTRLAPIEKVDMIAMDVRSIPLLANQILTEKLGQSIERVVHARESGRLCHTV